MRRCGAKVAVNCTGIRAEESPARRRRQAWSLDRRLSKAGRTVYNWLPIHDWTTEDVFGEIAAAGQEPFWAYAAGNKRLSCVFCIMGCSRDLANGKRLRPELYERYLELERETGYTAVRQSELG